VSPDSPKLDRRALLAGGVTVAAGVAAWSAARRALAPRASVFIAKDQRYDGPLAATIRDGLAACGLVPDSVRGKRVLLKPNLVEPTRDART
jgi:hypothetical protein